MTGMRPTPAIRVESVVAKLRSAVETELNKTGPQWTACVLGALASLASTDDCVDPDPETSWKRRGRTPNEYVLDLTISSWPKYDKPAPYEYPTYFTESASRPLRMLLVAESEWGDARDRKENGKAILEDFAKILSARAPVKVMVFSHFAKPGDTPGVTSSFDELTKHMVGLIRAAGDEAADYVLFGVAWDEREYKCVTVRSGIAADLEQGP